MSTNKEINRTVDWSEEGGRPQVLMIDQTLLPAEYKIVAYTDFREVASAIKTMVVRGAPAIGAAAALGMTLGAYQSQAETKAEFLANMDEVATVLRETRPTAVNLFWGIERMLATARDAASGEPFQIARVRTQLRDEARKILDEDVAANRAMGAFGAELLPDEGNVLTHCNAGALATVGYGTALGVIRAAVERGKRIAVFADETRPRLQGMKLTAWELARDGIEVTVLSDNTAGYLMRLGKIDCAVVGADRIAANGDTANKIGTYSVAVLARAHGIPFYVAAPLSTVDFTLQNGEAIPIEQRGMEEVVRVANSDLAPAGVPALNYAFDVTPAEYISAIITEKGVAYPPFDVNLLRLGQK
ncbi:MAG TPA: S-methyl-5-thioribose-1-phosphate isomerase [Capsulimonadaceae bacterium]|nr:S-methyl-5-thioribose-1-phosphate isomerase [Capsulimonadaceae bacterium]